MESVLLVETSDHVATLTINRPEKLNALSEQVVAELTRAFTELAGDESVRALVLTGAGEKAFVAGADIAAMAEMSAPRAKAFADAGHALMHRIEASRFPVIAAVNGFALGGG